MTAESYSEKHFLKSGDILFARTGATVGKTYYYDGSIGMAVFAGYCIRFRFDTKKVLPTGRMVFYFQKSDKCSSVPFDVNHLAYDEIVDSAEIKTKTKARIETILEQSKNGEI